MGYADDDFLSRAFQGVYAWIEKVVQPVPLVGPRLTAAVGIILCLLGPIYLVVIVTDSLFWGVITFFGIAGISTILLDDKKR